MGMMCRADECFERFGDDRSGYLALRRHEAETHGLTPALILATYLLRAKVQRENASQTEVWSGAVTDLRGWSGVGPVRQAA